ncbi:MAG: hypothetical protein MUE72_06805 [Chitinophagaceae bacterium]|jgi:hypothetical protein|nr:hypothetical protein [Chitinophagaceae bacterium]
MIAYVQTFLQISSHLTGFKEIELLGTGMLDTYLQTIEENNSSTDVQLFMQASATIIAEAKENKQYLDNAIATRLIPSSCYNNLAQNIITMWYTGTWNNSVISPQTYVQGLIWDVAEAHPPGAKQPGYGSWSIPPLSILIK